MHKNNEIRKRNPKFVIATVTVITAAVMLIATTAISNITTGSVLAYDKNQAKSDINECGNGFEPTNIGCQNIDSQIQGDENTVALTAQQTFPGVTSEPPPEPLTCVECVTELLTPEQVAAVEGVTAGATIEEWCAIIEGFTPEQQMADLVTLTNRLVENPLFDEPTIEELIDCLERAFGLTP